MNKNNFIQLNREGWSSMKKFLVGVIILISSLLFNAFSSNAQSDINHAHLLEYTSDGELKTVTTPEDWSKRRKQILEGMQLAMGDLPDRSNLVDLDIKVLNEIQGNGFIRKSITFASESGDRIPALLYLPSGYKKEKKLPAMLALHPTGPLGKLIVAGEGPLDNRQYGLELAQRGYVVFLW